MSKLFQTMSHGYLFPTSRNKFRNPQILLPISHIHNRSNTIDPNPKLDFIMNEVEQLQSSKPVNNDSAQLSSDSEEEPPNLANAEESWVNISHPWPEWVDLMECLLKRGYFEGDRNPFRSIQLGVKETNYIRTACLNFARDQNNLIRL